ncbi:MAG: ACP S-malonyltransferase [Chitinivibrionia bacterium]|nr:ACP S-malonyltransferase [Chitinivibrionia bacterium]
MAKELLFQLPGQGSHFLGMGKDLWDSGNKFFKELLEVGSDTVKADLSSVIFGDDEARFNQAKILQPAISAISLSYAKLLENEGIVPTVVMGHSLGEITALGVIGSLSPQKTVEFSAFRGILMDESSQICGGGTMTAVLLADSVVCQKMIDEAGVGNCVFVANDNAPTQAVVSGKIDGLEKFEKYATEEMHVKTKRIAVVGPWHTPFIQHAKDVFADWVKGEEIKPPKCKFIMNTTAKEESTSDEICKQITNKFIEPVRWRESCEYIKNMEFSAMLEVGPAKVLGGLMRANKIIKFADFHLSVSGIDDIKIAKEKMSGL